MTPQRLEKLLDTLREYIRTNETRIPDDVTGTLTVVVNAGGVQDIELTAKLTKPKKPN